MAGLDKPKPSTQEIAAAFAAFIADLHSVLQTFGIAAVATFNNLWDSIETYHRLDPDDFHMAIANKMEVDCPICDYYKKRPKEESK